MDGLKRNYEYVENELVKIRKSILYAVHGYNNSENDGQGITKSKLELLDKLNEQDADLCDTNNEFFMVLSELNAVINDGDEIIKNACKKYNFKLEDICKEVDVNLNDLNISPCNEIVPNSKDKADSSVNKTFDADKN